MMRNSVWGIVGVWVALLLPCVAQAQDISFRGADIVTLARTVAAEARRTGQLPPAYQMVMANDHTMVVTAPTVYELLTRAIIAWKTTHAFPTLITVQLLDLTGPAADPQYEPKRAGLVIAVPTADIGTYAPYWLQMAEAPGHQLPKAMTFETNYRLTAAQIVVTMAVLIDEAMRKTDIPSAVAIPLVRSPENWQDTRAPLLVEAHTEPPAPLVTADLQITLNGLELSERGPMLPAGEKVRPYCGKLRITLTGFGPIANIRLMLDNDELRSYSSLMGPVIYELDTLPLLDGIHTLSATATDTAGKTYAYVFSFSIANGRQSGFNPAELTPSKELKEITHPAL